MLKRGNLHGPLVGILEGGLVASVERVRLVKLLLRLFLFGRRKLRPAHFGTKGATVGGAFGRQVYLVRRQERVYLVESKTVPRLNS